MAGSTRLKKRRARGTVTYPWQNRLQRYREAARITQSQLAAKIGRGQTLIAGIETGRVSGRAYMDEIASVLNVSDPSKIFPDYYSYHTVEEAAAHFDVPSSMILRMLEEGTVEHKRIAKTVLIPDSELEGITLSRPRAKRSIRLRISDILASQPNGVPVSTIIEHFGPFESDDALKSKRQSIYSILSRSKDFVLADESNQSLWKLSDAA